MSPTVLIIKKYRFFFNSREEKRKHIHVSTSDGTAKFWLEPIVCLADYWKLSTKELSELQKIMEEKQDVFREFWQKHFEQ